MHCFRANTCAKVPRQSESRSDVTNYMTVNDVHMSNLEQRARIGKIFARWHLAIHLATRLWDVSDEITCKWLNHDFMMSLKHYIKLKTIEINFEKLCGWQVFTNHNCNPFYSSSSLSIPVCLILYLLCYLYLVFLFWAVIFMFRSMWWHFLLFKFW